MSAAKYHSESAYNTPAETPNSKPIVRKTPSLDDIPKRPKLGQRQTGMSSSDGVDISGSAETWAGSGLLFFRNRLVAGGGGRYPRHPGPRRIDLLGILLRHSRRLPSTRPRDCR
jgi:hypothetical protein